MTEQSANDSTHARVPMLAWSMLTLLLICVCVRTTSVYTPFPWWDGDPFTDITVPTGLTPTTALTADLLMIVFSLLTVFAIARAGGRVLVLPAVLIGIAQLVVVIHAFLDLNTFVGGTDLIAAAWSGYACWHATQLARARAVITGITLGFVCVLAAIGLHQVFVQHPQTVAAFESSRTAFLESRGWAPDSFQARTFERRLRQPTPTAWFGLTNVYASCVGAMGVALLALGIRAKRDWSSGVLGLAGLASVAIVVLSGSTGALGAVGIALAILLVSGKLRRVRMGPAILIASGFVVIGVITRGFIGERINELSILFRSQYMLGAWRAWIEEPLLGVGVGNFQEAYARLKPPTSPEDVASPHSIGFDLIATLGVGGIALLGTYAMMIWSISKNDERTIASESSTTRILMRVLGAITLISFALSIRLAMGASTLEVIGVQTVGTLAWFALAWVIVTKMPESSCRWAMAGAAAVLMLHAQLELTPVYAVSAALFAVMIGASATVASKKREQSSSKLCALLALWVLVMSLLIGWHGAKIVAWEWSIDRAGGKAHQIAIRDEATHDVGSEHWHREWSERTEIVSDLAQALERRPEHLPTRIALTEQLMSLGTYTQERFDDLENAQQMWKMALDTADFPSDQADRTAAEHRWAATVLMSRAASLREDEQIARLSARAIEHWERAAALNPHDPDLAVLIMDGYLLRADAENARIWAIRAQEINERMRLDPLRQFDQSTLERVRKTAE